MPEDKLSGDFLKWVDIGHANEANEALRELTWIAKRPPTDVVVSIKRNGEVPEKYIEAAKQAVRLSGTELVVHDPGFHKGWDVVLALEMIHDDSIKITSQISFADLEQESYISFKRDSKENLTTRIGNFIYSRMHRIRYVWPFDNEEPKVLRNLDFTPLKNSKVKVQKITWSHLKKNIYREEKIFETKVVDSDFFKIHLDPDSFP